MNQESYEKQPDRINKKKGGRIRRYQLLILIVFCTLSFLLGMISDAQSRSETNEIPAGKLQTDVEQNLTDAKSDQWNLILVNPWNQIPGNRDVSLVQLKNGQAVDERIYPDLQEMMDACRAEGLSPLIISSYRTEEKQTRLFKQQIQGYVSRGYSPEDAKTEAARWVAIPGTSEHQLGLAVDIVATDNQVLDESQSTTEVQKWLMENSYKYGFILRYPSDKSDITGIGFEPWHYRYVGKEAAAEITEKGVCLEEYLGS